MAVPGRSDTRAAFEGAKLSKDQDRGAADAFLSLRGPTAELIRTHDWASTPLGPIEGWPQSLRTATGLLVASPVPLVMLWGPEGVMIYNDAYSVFAGGRHPALLGSNVREGWPEVADFNDNVMKVGLAGGTLAYRDQALTLHRNGRPERVWMNLDYSPVPDESGRPAGVLAVVVETTERVLAERRQAAVIALDDAVADEQDPAEIAFMAARILGEALGAARVAYGEVEADEGLIVVPHDWTAEGLTSIAGVHRFRDYGTHFDALARGEAVRVGDVTRDPYTAADPGPALSLGVRAFLDVPLTERGRTVALLTVHSDAPRDWTDEEVEFARDFGERTRALVARRAAEAEVRAGRAELQNLTDNLPLLVAFVDSDLRYRFNNRAYQDWFGIAPQELVGKSLEEVLGDEAANKVMPYVRKVLGGERASFEQYMPYSRGGGRHIQVEYVPRRRPGGPVDGFYAMVQDVSERRRAGDRRDVLMRVTDALREGVDTAEMAQAAAEALGRHLGVDRVGYATLNAEAETVTVERDWTAPGVTPIAGTLRLRDWGDFIDDLKAGRLLRVEDVRGDPRTAHAVEDLETAHCRAFINVPVMEGGELVAMLFVNHGEPRTWDDQDVALAEEVAARVRTAVERTRAVAALRQSEARLRFLDELTTAAQASVDPQEILAIVTRRTARHLGVTNCAYADMDPDQDGFTIRGDWAAPGTASIVGHYSLAAFGKLAVQELSAGRPLIVDDNRAQLAPEEAANFQAIGISATICMPLVKEGRLLALMAVHHREPHRWTPAELATIREVTARSWAHIERVRSEAALRELNATLEERVERRTAELRTAHEALRQSQKMEAVGQLTGGIAHDFNNLLAGISGSLELMGKRLADGRTAGLDRYVEAAQGAAQRAAALTQRLLAFSRRQTLDPRPTEVNHLVREMEDLIRRSVGPAVEVEVRLDPDAWATRVDRSQLENALLNLCINSRDAMAPAGGRLTLATTNDRVEADGDCAAGDYVVLSVEDTGTGMPPEVIARIFDPFFTTKPIGQGTGLGLSMTHGFLRQSGGQVRVRSEVGSGTTMSLCLPRWTGPMETEGAGSTAPEAAEWGGGTLLVIDDEPTVRMLVAEVLSERGWRVLEAGDGASGLKVLEQPGRIDLLITDVGLPGGMNGRQVADAARVARPGLKVLFITGYAENAAVRDGLAGTGMEVMTKPFVMAELAARVAEMTEAG